MTDSTTGKSARSSTDALRRRVAASSFLGTMIEYYDFLLYGASAAVVFNVLFFPAMDPWLGTIASLTTLAAGYFARLLGGLISGHFGDRYGRKSVLVVTMLVMGLSSGLIGVLPTYAQIGPAAGLLLLFLRVVQGLAVGGEYGGAILMTAEHAAPGRRGFATGLVSAGAPAGSVLATGVMALVTTLPDEQLLSWGWRLPFLASFLLLGLGMYLRLRVTESPVFEERTASARPAGTPLARLLRTSGRRVLWGVAIAVGPLVGQGVMFIYIVSYATSIGYSRPQALLGITIGTLGSVGTALVFARMSDRIGRRPIVVYGSVATAVAVFPVFWLVNLGNPVVLALVMVVYTPFVMIAALTALPALLSELFDTPVRFTGVSLTYQLAQVLGSGLSPVIAAALLAFGGGGTNSTWIAVFVVVVALFSAVAGWRLPETATDLVRQPGAEPSRQTAGEPS
jgi:MFS family permease